MRGFRDCIFVQYPIDDILLWCFVLNLLTHLHQQKEQRLDILVGRRPEKRFNAVLVHDFLDEQVSLEEVSDEGDVTVSSLFDFLSTLVDLLRPLSDLAGGDFLVLVSGVGVGLLLFEFEFGLFEVVLEGLHFGVLVEQTLDDVVVGFVYLALGVLLKLLLNRLDQARSEVEILLVAALFLESLR